MASIIIREEDLTSSVLDEGIEVAFVPGFGTVTETSIPYINKFTLFTSPSSFTTVMGGAPRTFTNDFPINGNFFLKAGKTGANVFNTGDVEPGYCYALGLLQAGLPVIFYMANDATALTKIDPKTEEVTFANGVGTATITLDAGVTAVYGIEASIDDQMLNVVSTDIKDTTLTINLAGEATLNDAKSVKIVYTEYKAESDVVTGKVMYDALVGTTDKESILEELKDRGTYNVKYLTTGGYPSFEYGFDGGVVKNTLVAKLLDVAAAVVSEDSDNDSTEGRGDCIALIDHTNYSGRKLISSMTDDSSVFGSVNKYLPEFGNKLTFAAMYTPWCTYSINGLTGNTALPGSYAYLIALANASKIYTSVAAIAGVTRGAVPNIVNVLTDETLTNNIANKYQSRVEDPQGKISINAITRIRPYGNVIWGNRTLQKPDTDKGVTALGFTNIRSMVCDIKKTVYDACKKYMFEQNSDILWINFKSEITPTLEKMKSAQGIERYTVRKGENSGKTKLYAFITIKPVYSVESFDITITLTDEDLSVEEA